VTGTPDGFSKTSTWKVGFWLALVLPMSRLWRDVEDRPAPQTVRGAA